MAIQDEIRQHTLSKAELRKLLRRHWFLVVTVFIVGTVVMWASLSIFFTEIYETRAKLLVAVGRENVETPSTVLRGQVISQGVRAADINSEVQILSSRLLIEAAVDRLGPDAFKSVLAPPNRWTKYPKYYARVTARKVKGVYKEFLITAGLARRLTPREDAILNVADGVAVEPVRDSDILTLQVRTPSAKLCVEVANVLLETYMERRIALRRPPAGSEFFVAKLAEASKRLEGYKRTRAEMREKWNLTSPEEQMTVYLRQLSDIDSELVKNEAEIQKLKRQSSVMRDRSAAMPDLYQKELVNAANPSIQSIKDRITALKVERAKISTRYNPDSEAMNKIHAEILDLESALAQESATILDSVKSEANPVKYEFQAGIELQEAQISGLDARNQFLRGPASALKEEMRTLNLGIDSLEELEREYQRAEQDYLLYSKKLEEARMSEELDAHRAANVSLVAPPETPIKPVAPKKLFLMGIAMVVSLFVGVGVAALLETTEDRILDESCILDIDGIPYLGTVKLE